MEPEDAQGIRFEDCRAELIDGTYTNCGCKDCEHEARESRERDIECGYPPK